MSEKMVELFDHLFKGDCQKRNREEVARYLTDIARHNPPWTEKLIYNILRRQALLNAGEPLGSYEDMAPSKQMSEAIDVALRISGYVYTSKVVSVYQLPLGTMVLAEARVCRWRMCQVTFVPVVHNQIYHCYVCYEKAEKERKR